METSPNSKSLFNYYNAYKVILGLLLFTLVLSEHSFLSQFRYLDIFENLTLGYLVFNLIGLSLFWFFIQVSPKQIFAVIFFDIIFLHGIFYCATGIAEGLGNLVIISVAAGNIIIRGRIGLSFAALAAILSLLIEIERFLGGLNHDNDIAQGGIIGIMYFASAFLLQNLSVRISENESLLRKQQQDLIELEKLNRQIIQSMRTGIIVCSEQGQIKLINEACKDLLNLETKESLPAALEERLKEWKQAPSKRTSPFKVNADSPTVQANFSNLQTGRNTDVLIFIEDTRKMTQQAQQLKLASLGRLTASIAHEVRNPLGAISHATQLLAESENLDFADIKMTDIIQRHSQRVNQIIENTLQLSRRSEPSIESVLITPWVKKIVYDFQVQQDKDTPLEQFVVVSSNDMLSARFDANQMEQVLINLIDNARHHGEKNYTDATTFIIINENKEKNQAYIDVVDQGPGIDTSNAAHLFEPFFTTESQGTGLGLYLSREICEANQAHLDYLDPHANYADWIIPPSTQDNEMLALANSRPFGACFRVMFAHHKRIL